MLFVSAIILAVIFGFLQPTSPYQVHPLPGSVASLGEGPHWDVEENCLYYVDVTAGRLLRYVYEENKVYSCKIKGENFASFVIPVQGRQHTFAVGCGRRVVLVAWNGRSTKCQVIDQLFEVQTAAKFDENRFNDGKCDPKGRLFAGTMKYTGDVFEYRYGELYKYENGEVKLIKTNVGVSNGLAWNERRRKFYYIDTADKEVKEYDYNFKTGAISSCPKIVYDLNTGSANQLYPDGLTIDTDGNLYVAIVSNGTVVKVDPRTGEVLLEIKFPDLQVTSAAFGGPNLKTLFVTTGFIENVSTGTTYRVTGLGAKGLPMTKIRL